MTIAFAYFTKSEVLLSIWVFHLLTVLQVGILTRFGLDMGASDPYTSYHPAVGWQSFGSLIVFVFWGLWVARNHLTAVVRKAFVGDDSVETGLVFLRTPLTGQAFAWHLFGSSGIGPVSATALGLSGDAKTLGITTLAHIPRLGLAVERVKESSCPRLPVWGSP